MYLYFFTFDELINKIKSWYMVKIVKHIFLNLIFAKYVVNYKNC